MRDGEVDSVALVLAAHGSNREPAVNAAVCAHAEALAGEGLFQEAHAAFHQGQPRFCEVLDRTTARHVMVVPLMTSAGYYSDEVLPRELLKSVRVGAAARTDARSADQTAWAAVGDARVRSVLVFSTLRVALTRPVGTHPRVTSVVAERIEAWRIRRGEKAENVAVVLIGHGTKRNVRSRAATEFLAEELERAGVCGETQVAFLDEEPSIETLRERVGRRPVLAIPFLIGGGPHAREDIPRRMGVDSSDGVFLDAPVGTWPQMRGILHEVAEDARQWMRAHDEALQRDAFAHHPRSAGVVGTLRLGTRCSALALWQARHVANRLAERGIGAELVEMTTRGDRRLDCALAELGGDAPFTEDLEDALRRRDIDLAVHARKDLPVTEAADVELAAILPRGDVTESLVSRRRLRLAELPPGARVGTSSPRRAAQLLRLRPDVRPAWIRGAVEDRIRQVRDGRFDAAVLATAGLQRLGLTNESSETFSPEDLLPAPGQGALAVQIRRGDERLRRLVAFLNHEPTRRAVAAEWTLLRRMPDPDRRPLAAWARVRDDGAIVLYARWLSLDGQDCAEAQVQGDDPLRLAQRAYRILTGVAAAKRRSRISA